MTRIEELLVQSLADVKVSRAERQELARAVAAEGLDARELDRLRARAFELARSADPKLPRDQILESLQTVLGALAATPAAAPVATLSAAYFSPKDPCARQIMRLFEEARRQVDVCVFTITDDDISKSILDAHRRGIRLRVITDNDKSTDLGSDIDRLAKAGVTVRRDETEYHMHHKFALFDERTLLTGSYNWTRGAARYNEENFLVTTEPGLVRAYTAAFEGMWRDFAGSQLGGQG